MGSLGFSAPEQFDAPDRVTAAADVCSIARCLVFMYLGENLPIEILSAPEKVVRRIASTDAVRDVLKKGCHAKLKVRYKSVREFWDAYEEALTAREPAGGSNVIMMVLPQGSISMIGLPEGRFLMGTPDETGDELPHFVRLSAFGLSETTVTEGQWNAVMDGPGRLGGSGFASQRPANWGRGPAASRAGSIAIDFVHERAVGLPLRALAQVAAIIAACR